MSPSPFDDGVAAFKMGKRPLDNPYFALPDQTVLFDEWSDGWIVAAVESGTLTRMERFHLDIEGLFGYPPRWRSKSLRGLTASWSQESYMA